MNTDFLKRKEKIIISAIDTLDEVGIQGLTTKELAKREGITEPAIYRQFDCKQDIIMAILDRFAEFDIDIVNTIIEQNMSTRDGILYFSDSYASYYQSYPQIITVMFSYDVFRYNEKLNERMLEILHSRIDFITSLATKEKELSRFKMDPEDFASMIHGAIWGTIYIWKLDNCKTPLREMIMKRINWLLEQALDGKEEIL